MIQMEVTSPDPHTLLVFCNSDRFSPTSQLELGSMTTFAKGKVARGRFGNGAVTNGRVRGKEVETLVWGIRSKMAMFAKGKGKISSGK